MQVNIEPKLDFLGREILPNDLIVYPTRRRSALEMKQAVVIRAAVVEHQHNMVDVLIISKADGKNYKLFNFSNAVIIQRDYDGNLEAI